MSSKRPRAVSPYRPSPELQKRLKVAEEFGMTEEKFQEMLDAAEKRAAAERADAQKLRDEDRRRVSGAVNAAMLPDTTQFQAFKSGVDTAPSAGAENGSESQDSPPQTATTAVEPPDWIHDVRLKLQTRTGKAALSRKGDVIKALNALKDCLDRCESTSDPALLPKYFDELRDHIHEAEFLEVDKYVLVKRHMLDNGLNRIFNPKGTTVFPWDLVADARQLYRRWAEQNFSTELLRGITTYKEGDRSADRLDLAWREKYGHTAQFHGNGHLVLGQWWPTQLCTVREGAHGGTQGGIYGERKRGAYSIIVSSGSGYDDRDEGDRLLYCGTDSATREPTEATMRLIESCDVVKQPVRVLRSHMLPKSNPYRPERGIRYDGLYDVQSYEVLDPEKAVHRFLLVRCPGQHPIRAGKGAPSTRPTKYEIEHYDDEVMTRGYEIRRGSKTVASAAEK